jgi:hypothetical protein
MRPGQAFRRRDRQDRPLTVRRLDCVREQCLSVLILAGLDENWNTGVRGREPGTAILDVISHLTDELRSNRGEGCQE